MKGNHKKIISFILLAILSFTFLGNNNEAFSYSPVPLSSKASSGFVHASGSKILDGNNKEFLIKGIAFGNDVWGNPALPLTTHHTENSYKLLNSWGFNSVRFYLNYAIFENDQNPYHYKQTGWDYLDKNIAWAKKYHIKLVLNMHYPQGGFQSNGDGMKLWTDPENQKRLIALWKEIAKHYKNEPTIMAFDLLNEPIVTELKTEESTFGQWKGLAEKLLKAIRSVDKNHMIIVERLNASKNVTTGEGNWDPNRNGDMNFFLLKDKNVAYEFHMYEPMEFTHQNASWIERYKGSFSKYPDENAIKTTGDVKWENSTFENPVAANNTSDWQYIKGVHYKVSNTRYLFAQPTLQAMCVGEGGTAWFDDIVVKEYDEKDNYVRTIYNLTFNDGLGWSMWQAGASKGTGEFDPNVGHDGMGSLKITNTTEDANLSSYLDRIKLQQGHSYEISGYVKVDHMSPSSQVRLRLDFYSGDSIQASNKDYLEKTIEQYLTFGKKYHVPLYLGEFGCISDAFKEGRGGERFVSDMIDICKENRINFNYHTFHEEAFGLYQNSAYQLPGNLNNALLEVFKKKLNKIK